MPSVSLIYSGAPKLLNEKPRTVGLHHSSILSSYCISQGYYSDNGPIDPVLAEVGLAHEKAVSDRLLAHQPVEIFGPDPNQLSTFLSLINEEIKIDGIYITLDLIHLNPYGPYSIKHTAMSSRNEPLSDKFIPYEMQLMSECVALQTQIGFLDVTFRNGDYKSNKQYERRIWQYQFERDELRRHWNVILTEAQANHGWVRK